MAELDFKHHVGAPQEGAALPKPFQRTEHAEATNVPDIQGTVSRYAEATNWMSSLGSSVAAKASNALATKLGSELGRNPQGNIGPSFTDFDKELEQSYATQSQSTLAIQAQKLISQSNIELASAPRMTPSLIGTTQKNVYNGLQQIYSQAPDDVRTKLETQYTGVMIQQNEQLHNRYIKEQREDRVNNADLSSKLYGQNAYTLALHGVGLDKDGDSIPAVQAIKDVDKLYTSLVKTGDKTPLERDAAIETVRQSALSGKGIREALAADKAKKLPEFMTKLANDESLKPEDRKAVIGNILQYMQQQATLKNYQENLVSQQMHNRISTDPTNISDQDWANFASQVSPLKEAQMRFNMIQALKSKKEEGTGEASLIANWESPEAHANATPKIINASFYKQVDNVVQGNPSISRDQAENQVASAAGATIPVFTKTLKNKLWSGDPAQMVAGARQIDDLQSSGNGHAVADLSAEDLAMASDIGHNNNPQDPAWAAKMVAENKENQDPTVRKASQDSLATYLYEKTTKSSTPTDDFVLKQVGLQGGIFHSGFDSPWLKGKYASDILSVFSQNYINTRGDVNRAWQLTNEHVQNNYGKTKVNGDSQWTKHPIEKAVGLNEGEGLNSINKDIIRQISPSMTKLKESFDKGSSDHFWSIESGTKIIGKKPSEASSNSYLSSQISKNEPERLQFVKHTRNGIGTNIESYPLVLVGNNFNWELNIQTDHGPRTIFLEAPEIGVHKYTPDKQWIQNDYLHHSGTGGA